MFDLGRLFRRKSSHARLNSVDEEDIRFLYRVFFDRDPESAQIISEWSRHSWRAMVSSFISSREFASSRNALPVSDKKVIYRTKYGFDMPISLLEPRTFDVYVLNDYEEQESRFIDAHILPGDYCVDAGARHGWFSGIMARRTGASGRVYAFEPGPPPCSVREVAEVNDFGWITLIQKGLSDLPGLAPFDATSLSMLENGRSCIEVARMDDELQRRDKPIALMKVDIEGAEYKMLQGAQTIVRQDRPIIVMELSEQHQRDVSHVSIATVYDLVISIGYRCIDTAGVPIDRSRIVREADGTSILNVAFVPVEAPIQFNEDRLAEVSGR